MLQCWCACVFDKCNWYPPVVLYCQSTMYEYYSHLGLFTIKYNEYINDIHKEVFNNLPDWSQTTLYKWLLVNVSKVIKTPILQCIFYINIWVYCNQYSYYMQTCFKNVVGYLYFPYILIIAWVTNTTVSAVCFCLVPTPKRLSLNKAPPFLIHIGMKLSKTGDILINYYL